MIQPRSNRRLLLPMWLVLMGGLLALGLWAGYRWPEVTATLVLVTLVGIWMIAERVTARWW
jgi:hypothetical protein